MLEDGIEGNGDVYPLSVGRQKGGHDLMVTFAAREYLALLDNLHDLWRKPRRWIIRNANYYKLHSGSKFFNLHFKGRGQV